MPPPQVRVFSSSDHLRALAAGEVDVVVGWSGGCHIHFQDISSLSACQPAQLGRSCLRAAGGTHAATHHPLSAAPPCCLGLRADEVLPVVQRTNNLEAAAPLSGTSLFADCWCIPAAAAGG